MNLNGYVKEFQENGYVVVRNMFSKEEIDGLHELISESSKIATFDSEKTTVGGGIAEKKLDEKELNTDIDGKAVGVAQKLDKANIDGKAVGVAQRLDKANIDGKAVGVAQRLDKANIDGKAVGVAQKLDKANINGNSDVNDSYKKSEKVNQGLNDVFETNEKYSNFYKNKELLNLVSQLIETDSVKLLSDTVLHKPAYNGAASPIHRDSTFWKNLEPNNQINVWIPLQDTDEKNGTLGYVPGSHKDLSKEYKPDILQEDELQLGDDIKDKFVNVNLEKGDVLLHHSNILHGTNSNTTDQARTVYVLHYTPQNSKVVGDFFKDIQNSPDVMINGEVI